MICFRKKSIRYKYALPVDGGSGDRIVKVQAQDTKGTVRNTAPGMNLL
jgi:hypothetical protein